MVRDKRSKIVFLIETKIDTCRLERVKRRIRFLGCLGVSVIGRKGVWPYCGGTVSLWRFSTYHRITFLLGLWMIPVLHVGS